MRKWQPDWKLSAREELAVRLSLAMHKHVPGWGGATDEQLDAVAASLLAIETSDIDERLMRVRQSLRARSGSGLYDQHIATIDDALDIVRTLQLTTDLPKPGA